jgi:uncharacterized repeat protein (TIGR01451 family)
MKSKILKMFGVLLLLSMMLMAMPAPAAAQTGPDLSISVTPPDGSNIFCGDAPTVTATVSNTGDECAEDVVITAAVISDPAFATLSNADPDDGLIYDICPDSSKQATWTLTCDGPGPVTVQFTATPTNGAPEVTTVTYQQLCRLEVKITSPADGDTVAISDTFAVTATVTNNTSEMCTDVGVTLGYDSYDVERIGGSDTYIIDLPAGDTEELNWTMHCLAAGATVFTVQAVGCGQTGACVTACADTITIYQAGVCGLDLVITSLPVGEICVGSTFTIEGYVENTGTKTLTGVDAKLTADTFPTSVSIVPSDWYLVTSSLAPGATAPVSWDVTCEGREQTGENEECLDEFIDFTAEARATCITTDDMYDSETLLDYANQKFVIVELLPPTVTCHDFCINDEWLVDMEVHNCLAQPAEGVIEITVGGNAVIVTPPNAQQEIAIPAGGTVRLSDQGGPLPWHVKCISPGDVIITVKFLGVVGTVTLCDTDSATIHQKTPADIEVVVDASPCAQYCEEFYVTATVTNSGDANAAPISNVSAVMTTTGDVEPVGVPVRTGDADEDGLLDKGETWTYTWTFHCDGPDDATFKVDVTGEDAVCGGTVSDSASDSTEQVKLDVNIISPAACSTYEVCDTFCVTAEISDNDPDTCFSSPLTITISFPNGKASLANGETAAKDFALTDGDTQQVSWTVHCDEAGDTDIMVDVTGSAGNPEGCDDCELFNKRDTITIHQKTPVDITATILSPRDCTNIATSEDFAVTAMIYNGGMMEAAVNTAEIIVSPTTAAHVTESPDVPFTLGAGESKTITWTLHCDGSGNTSLSLLVSGEDELGKPFTAKESSLTPITWQELQGYKYSGMYDESGDVPYTTFMGNTEMADPDLTDINNNPDIYPDVVPWVGDSFTITADESNPIPAGTMYYLAKVITPEHSDVVVTDTPTGVAVTLIHTNGAFRLYEVKNVTGDDVIGDIVVTATPSSDGVHVAFTWDINYATGGGTIPDFWWTWLDDTEDSNWDMLDWIVTGPVLPGVTIYQYPAAHLEVQNIEVSEDTVNVCDNFVVEADIVNTGEADAWEVSAILEVFPEGSARVVEGGGGYSQYIGTLVGHGQDGTYHVSWTLHCKMACESTITITAAGYDEYGWHLKQDPQTGLTILVDMPGRAIDEKFIEPASVTVKQLEPSADLSVIKIVNVSEPVVVGTEVTFTVSVGNSGPSDATSIWLYDLLPAGLNFVEWDASQGYYFVSSGYWSVGDLADGDSAWLTITATVNEVGDIENLAAIDFADQHDPVTGNNADTATVTGEAAPPVTTVSLVAGDNLISLPLIPEDPDIETLLSGLDVIKVAAYSPFQEWMFYDPDPLVPDDLTEMNDGWGYWIEMGTPGTLSYPGYELVEPPPHVPPSYALVEGWNLIGFKSTTPKSLAEYLAGVDGKYIILYGYANGSYFIAGTAGHEYLEPGLGYWIAMIEPGTIYP